MAVPVRYWLGRLLVLEGAKNFISAKVKINRRVSTPRASWLFEHDLLKVL
jgi:hypothetical protein